MTATESSLASEIRTLGEATRGPFPEISHELRTPLTVIAGYVELLQEDQTHPLTPGQQAMLATVDRNVARLWELVENLLDSASMEWHPYRVTRSPVSLTELTASAVATARPQASARGVTLAARHRGALVIGGDPVQLAGLVARLLSDAVSGAPEGSRVGLTAARGATAAELRVTTMPPGMRTAGPGRAPPPEPFRDAQVSLAICRTIAANHGGELECSPASVAVRLPLAGGSPGPGSENGSP